MRSGSAGTSKDPIARIAPGSLPAAEESALLNTLSHIDNGTVPTGPLAKKWGRNLRIGLGTCLEINVPRPPTKSMGLHHHLARQVMVLIISS